MHRLMFCTILCSKVMTLRLSCLLSAAHVHVAQSTAVSAKQVVLSYIGQIALRSDAHCSSHHRY